MLISHQSFHYQAVNHGSVCPHAPCACGEPGCTFAGSPPELVKTSMPRRTLARGQFGCLTRVGVFVLAVADRAARTVLVPVSCVRAPGAAATGQETSCDGEAVEARLTRR